MSETEFFRQRFFADISLKKWEDWRWQLAHKITRLEELERFFPLTLQEKKALEKKERFAFAITPYYLSLLEKSPLRKTMIPVPEEALVSSGETKDPLGETPCLVAPNLVHRYPDRVLFLVTQTCSAYCRYCTRARLVGQKNSSALTQKKHWEEALSYIQNHPEVRDVLISGGDPLTLSDTNLAFLLSSLRKIPHVEMIRIGTKVPAVLPMRITTDLVEMLKKYHPIYFSVHFTHPDEITTEVQKACIKLADGGIPLGSQTVLLKDVNDNADVLKSLMHKLLQIRVRPYYLFQCDPIVGSHHFRVPVKKGLELIQSLRGNTSGYAVPTYAIDIPGGGGKIILNEERILGRQGNFLVLKNFENKTYLYPDFKE